MPMLMRNKLEIDDAANNECELHTPTRTTTHKGGWFGLTTTVVGRQGQHFHVE